MKTRAFTLLIAILAITGLHAQDLQIHKTDGTVITVPLNAIDSITFIESGGIFVCGLSTITDIDGNIYNTLLIGNQCWMKENLKTTKYRNGTPIEYPGDDINAWVNNSSGAYAWYDNDIGWKHIYGALYNWYAVVNSNGLCPDGWHVPSDAEWTQLINYLAGQGFPNNNSTTGAGNTLKSCRQVDSPLGGVCNTSEHPRWDSSNNHHGFDEFGFSGLPGGFRNVNTDFGYLGIYGHWRTSTTSTSTHAWIHLMHHGLGVVGRYIYHNVDGLSVRCLRDVD